MARTNKTVLHVITTINRGGAENHLLDLVRGQRTRGWDVAVAYLKGDGYWSDTLTKAGIQVYPLDLRRYGDPVPWVRLRRLVKRFCPSIVHAHLPPAELYVRLAIIGLRDQPAFVISKHNDEPFYKGPGSKPIAKWVSKRASHLIAISDAVRRYMAEILELSRDRISTIHYGIDPAPYRAVCESAAADLRDSWLAGEKGWIVGTVARLVRQKALHVLLQGYAIYRKHATQESRLVIVGAGPLEGELRADAERLGIAGKVIWAGFREDIPIVVAAFDTFVLTSIYEGFGLVLLEAMSAGRPVVASAVSAIPEVVVDGRTGLLVPPANPDRVAGALAMMEVDSDRTRYGRAGYERVVKHFTLDRMIDSTIEVYARCRFFRTRYSVQSE